ncbi:hypothetical protein ACF0H5_023340 [Mactra antiquata]
MVMHARKLPRIDDGYPDKRETQSFQSSQYPSKAYNNSNHSDRYERRKSPGRDSPASRNSPRYSNKSSYIERNKERGSDISPGKKVNNYGGSSNTNNGGSHDNRTLSSRSSSNSKDKTEVQKSAIRTCGDWSEHLSSMGKKYYYNIKSETSQWERPREWSDSSAVRPDDHSSENRTNDRRSTKDGKNRHTSGGLEKRDKYLDDVRRLVADGNPKPDKIYLLQKLQQSHSENKHMYSDTKDSHRRNNDDGSSNDFPNSSHPSQSRRDSDSSRTLPRQASRNDQDDIESPCSSPTSHRSVSTPHGVCPASNLSHANLNISNIPNLIRQIGGQNSQELTQKALQTLQKLQQALSRQIIAHQTSVASQSSQSSTIQASPRHHIAPLHEETVSSYQHSVQQQQQQHTGNQCIPGSLPTPGTPSHPAHRSPFVNTQNNLSQSHSSPQLIETQAMTVSPVATTMGSTGSIPITHTGNHIHRGNTVYGKFLGSQNQTSTPNYPHTMDDILGENSKVTDAGGGGVGVAGGNGSARSSCCSPAPSDTSSQGAPVDPEMFSSNINQKETNLMSSLSQYYHENSVAHVTGWQGELFEKQARLYREEALKIGSLISSQVSVELKRARSLVRVEEIQATLHEQRNLFLAQQIAELENMKPVSSVSSFLPTSSSNTS